MNITMAIDSKPGDALANLTIPSDRRSRKGTPWGLLFWAIVCLGAVGGGIHYWNSSKTTRVKIVSVEWSAPIQDVSVLKASGYVTPRRRATIASKITGRVSELFFDEGMRVEKDQVLSKLDDEEAKDAVNIAEADLEVAQALLSELEIDLADARKKLARAKILYNQNTASTEHLEASQMAVDGVHSKIQVAKKQIKLAQTRLQAAKQVLGNYTIKAPFSGIVVSKDAQIGEIVSPVSAGGGFTRTGIATIVDMDSLEIEVDVNESYIARVKVGQRVEAFLDAYPEWKLPAHVRTVIPTADRQKATVKVRILFDRLDPKILPDMGVKVSFLEKEKPSQGLKRILTLPQSAILKQNEKTVVFVFKEDHVERRNIKTGNRHGHEIEVEAGLVEGELVVVENVSSLEDGQKAGRLE